MRKKKVYAGLLAGVLAISLTSCGGQAEKTMSSTEVEEKNVDNETDNAEVEEKNVNNGTDNGEVAAASTDRVESEGTMEEYEGQLEESETPEPTPEQATEGQELLKELSNWSFYFSSGAGAWGTSLDINEDGSFSGFYSDSDMGDTGKGYPGGTVYFCDFAGQFTEPVKINDYTYSMKIKQMDYKQEENTEEIKNKQRYIYSSAYGLDGADEIYIYTPDALVNKLPKGYMSWVYRTEDSPRNLDCYGLYNVVEEDGFTSTKNSEKYQKIKEELRVVEDEAAQIEQKIETEALSQLEYNELSGELYQLWDDELNAIWNQLKNQLDKEIMEYLTQDERDWIKEKEKTVKKAGAEYEGGSMQPMVENLKAAELTRERTYQLINWLKYE